MPRRCVNTYGATDNCKELIGMSKPTCSVGADARPADVRGTAPGFWSSDELAAMDWHLIYDGPVPKRVNSIAPMTSAAEYVYLLFDGADELVYVGRSFRPADRFTKHRRKPWWGRVVSVAIVRVDEDPPYARPPWMTYGPNTARFEALAIDRLQPPANIAAPARSVLS